MKWDQLLFMFVFTSLLFLIMTTVVFYIRHWSGRHAGGDSNSLLEGEYFKRYLPEYLRNEYEKQQGTPGKSKKGRFRALKAKIATAVTVLLALGISIFSIERNMDSFLPTIDLTAEEIKNLDYTQHQWNRHIDFKLPRLSTILPHFSDRGFIIPFDDKDKSWLFNGQNIRKLANEQWNNFAQSQQFKMLSCSWAQLSSCRKKHPEWIVLVLPGFWNLNTLDEALGQGANVITYGPPAQISMSPNKIAWQGIQFSKEGTRDNGEIILRGDQLLTLDFDAGLVIDAFSAFGGYQVFADNPQAVNFNATYEVEVTKGTRLYAKSVGQGRLVWLDFPPDPIDNSLEVNVTHLNALVASIFRYFSRQPYSAIATWPQGKPFAALVDEDTEDQFQNANDVIELSQKYGYPISWYILSNQALKHRSIAKNLPKYGEIACHGDHHGVFTLSNSREQVIRIARCKKVLKALTGIEPKAFRPPEERHNSATIDAIANNGMDHFIAVNSPDRAVPEKLVSLTNGKSLISIPRMINDDYELWHVRGLNYIESTKIFDGEVKWSRLIGGVHMFSFHTQFIDDHDHFRALQHLCDQLIRNKAYFQTSQAIADWWRFRQLLSDGQDVPIDLIKQFQPMRVSVNERGELKLEAYQANQNNSHDNNQDKL